MKLSQVVTTFVFKHLLFVILDQINATVNGLKLKQVTRTETTILLTFNKLTKVFGLLVACSIVCWLCITVTFVLKAKFRSAYLENILSQCTVVHQK